MRLLAWNIRQGGGSRLARIDGALAHHKADILVLSEYRGGEATARLRAALESLVHRITQLISARYPFHAFPAKAGIHVSRGHRLSPVKRDLAGAMGGYCRMN